MRRLCYHTSLMLYYYLIPSYLTGVFLASYTIVRLMLAIFDMLNPFWDRWDVLHRRFWPMVYIEWLILGAFVCYIVFWELSGAADPQGAPDLIHRIGSSLMDIIK
ncbi:MAG: hypothetical protein HQM09_15825 [Candidatus Riflebacteria bacterium]|nr:hypothetical protein [Candidatus Riflebacteria bacterium]